MTASRCYALLAVASLAFIAFGSFVPFHSQSRPLAKALEDFAWVMQNRLRIESRSDLVANVLLGVPLGFGLLGAIRVDRPGRRTAVWNGLALWPGCVAYAAAVEFAQLYFPGRTSSAIDIVAQGVGAAVGMAGWVLVGQRTTDAARRIGGPAGWVLLAYLGLVAFTQLLPLDLSASPYRVRVKIRDGHTTLIPFAEWSIPTDGLEPDREWLILTWLGSAVLFLPAGLILARFPGRVWKRWFGLPVVLMAGLGLGLLMEAGQLLVSRHPSVTDALMGAMGLTFGWLIVKMGIVGIGFVVNRPASLGRWRNSV